MQQLKKNLGRSTRAGVVGRSVQRCLRLFVPVARVRACARADTCARAPHCVCVRFSGQRVVQTRVYRRGTLLPWTRSKLPVGHFVSAILFARYLAGYFDLDALRSLRYLFACTTYATASRARRTRPPRAAKCFANSDERRRIRAAEISAPPLFRDYFFTRGTARAPANEPGKLFGGIAVKGTRQRGTHAHVHRHTVMIYEWTWNYVHTRCASANKERKLRLYGDNRAQIILIVAVGYLKF